VNARVFDGSYSPRVLSFRPGDQVIVNLTNQLGEPTNLHTHGMFVSPVGNSDNIFPVIESGGAMQYNYATPKDLDPGSNWYHPHMHPLVEEQVFGGMSGFFYVQGLQDLLPTRLRGVPEHFLAFKDLQVDRDNTIRWQNINSDAPTTRTVNGLVRPVLEVAAGSTQMWHLGNFSADIWYRIRMPGVRFTVLAEDGQPLRRITGSADALLFPPARRFDVLVQFPEAGSFTMKTLKMTTGPAGDTYPAADMMTVNVTGPDRPVVRLPHGSFDPDAADYSDNTVSVRRTVVLTEDNKAGTFSINGRQFFGANDITASPFLGQTEEWTFLNRTREKHPIHIHVNDMQIMSVNGRARKANGLVDTFPMPYATKQHGKLVPGRVVVRMKFRKFAGSYVFHCHILAHEDNGMMAVVTVTKKGTAGG
jgi:FtsP/CotA-like multicopper oxidase with cupredoxin domain